MLTNDAEVDDDDDDDEEEVVVVEEDAEGNDDDDDEEEDEDGDGGDEDDSRSKCISAQSSCACLSSVFPTNGSNGSTERSDTISLPSDSFNSATTSAPIPIPTAPLAPLVVVGLDGSGTLVSDWLTP